jgi:Kef-type K+ transport system membrane component KefB
MGMSALPVLARILAERNMMASSLGDLVMGATAVDDVMAWCLLSIVVAIVRSNDPLKILYTFVLAIAGFIVIFYPIKRTIQFITRRVDTKGEVDPGMFFGIFWVILAVSYAFEAIGLSALVGAFFVGLIIPRKPALVYYIYIHSSFAPHSFFSLVPS